MIEIIGQEQLEEFIWENSIEKKIIVIYFGAEWCGPCQKLKEKILSLEAKEIMPDLVVAYLDMDQSDNEAISETYTVKSLPTQIFVSLKGTQIIEQKRIRGYDWTNFLLSYKKLDKMKNNSEITISVEPKGANSINYE